MKKIILLSVILVLLLTSIHAAAADSSSNSLNHPQLTQQRFQLYTAQASRLYSFNFERNVNLSNRIQVQGSQKPAVMKEGIPAYVPGELLVKYKNAGFKTSADLQSYASTDVKSMKAEIKESFADQGLPGVYLVKFSDINDLAAKKSMLDASPNVEYTSYNYVRHAAITPNDPYFSGLWGLNNYGQFGGTVGADINATYAWNISTGSPGVVIAVIDSGVDYNHPDLKANMWVNPVDRSYGYDFYNNDTNPMDDNGHGTHVSGTIAAIGNNKTGVAGVNWNSKIMALKFLSYAGYGYDDDAIKAILYAQANGAKITSNSWGGAGYDPILQDVICNDQMLNIFAAGNEYSNSDIYPFYPASYYCPDIISVAASDWYDNKADFSNWGRSTVDVAAPGVEILSTFPIYRSILAPRFNDAFNSLGKWQNTGQQDWILDTIIPDSYNYTSPPTDAATGAYVDNGIYYLDKIKPVSLAGFSNPQLEFDDRIQTEPGYDFVIIYISTDGKYWEPYAFASGDFGPYYYHETFPLDRYKGKSIYVSFALVSDYSISGYPGYWVDDVKIGNGEIIDQYAWGTGTSMATPHVAGIAGLLKAKDPTLTPLQIKSIILQSAEKLPQWKGMTVTGGRVDAFQALMKTKMSSPTISSLAPASGYQNTAVPFIIGGTNFQPGATVVLWRTGSSNIQATVTSSQPAKISGVLPIPADAVPGLWNLKVKNGDGGNSTRVNAFTVKV
jgi:subtilisin family serine protease